MNDNGQIISHLYLDENTKQWVIQINAEHQKGVAEIAAIFAGEFGLPYWGYVLGMLHDKGKERASFQQYIRAVNGLPVSDTTDYNEHNHSFVGGLLANDLFGEGFKDLLVNQIISHHSGLHDCIDLENVLQEKKVPGEIESPHLDKRLLVKELNESPFCRKKVSMEHFHHLSRMLFSCLIDADRLDTERFMNEDSWKKRGNHLQMFDLLPKLEKYVNELQSKSADTEINRIRRNVMELCVNASEGEKGFYSLTVPTGGGKTLSSLMWAMKHAVKHGMKRVIIAIPYTSIIVQTAGILKTIFGEENVLEHHSNFDVDDIKDDIIREKARLATENWDYPIIVTTNVQFFESVFSNKPTKCRKLHNIVNSVLILDEVQTLPMSFLQPIVDSMKAYVEMFGVSMLFTTASQPVLNGTIQGSNPSVRINGIDHIEEIISDKLELHDKLRRVELKIDRVGRTYDEIADEISKYDKVLCIVNTRKDAKEVFDRLPEEGIKLHLSRMMCPAHISKTINEIKAALKDNRCSIIRVVATQLVEAGVDIDFPIVFRQEAGLDSILQAAGRCNREGKESVGYTFVFSLSAENRTPFGSMAASNNARLNLPEDSDWFAPSTMEKYFIQLYSRINTFDKKEIKSYLYKPKELYFKQADEVFKLIDDDAISLIVNWENSMDLVERLKECGCVYSLMKQLSKYVVGVHRSDFNELLRFGAVYEVLEGIYVLPDAVQYNCVTGLRLDNHWMEEILMI